MVRTSGYVGAFMGIDTWECSGALIGILGRLGASPTIHAFGPGIGVHCGSRITHRRR